ncbi:MAG: hypothetical protein DI535_23215 [Citrobacter freundii]|nr:MAG: hypothetical protein DI535_23215 [Citrobacter freundii]
MPAIIFYYVAPNICFLVGYILYSIFLRKETDFKSIRYYWLLVMIGSLVLPIVNFELPFGLMNIFHLRQQTNFQNTSPNFSIWPSKQEMLFANAIKYIQWVTIIYFSVVVLLCSRMLLQISSLGICIYKSNRVKKKGYTLVFNNRFNGTFSFFRWVFVNENTKHTEGIEAILAHEAAHCRQRHTIDVMLAELIAILFWFNPLIWKIKKSIKLNHEYLADQSVLASGIILSAEYQMILLNRAAEGNLFSYVSSFGGNMLKNRILMLLAVKNNERGFKYKVITVMLCCIILVFITTGFINVENNTAKKQQAKMQTKSIEMPAAPMVKKPQVSDDEPISVQNIPRRQKASRNPGESNQVIIEDKKRTR